MEMKGYPPRYLHDHDIVASFKVEKPVSFLGDNILQLENDIFDEIGFRTIKVVILSLEPLTESNVTKVVFGVDPDARYSKISPTSLSLIKSSFEYLVIHQSSLSLTKSLFGDSYFFEVLKLPGGITVIPPQSAFLLQKVQIHFNFTLNFSIYQIQLYFDELRSQLKSGLHLAPYENLYIILSNSKGSTVAPPTIVQSKVLLAVGNSPSTPRLKQLAQTITGSHSKNLGLNHTVFGKVKQVRLSSILQHSLHGVAPTTSTEKGAAPAPEAHSPTPETISPASQRHNKANPPGSQHGNKRIKGKPREEPNLAPAATPKVSPHHSAVPPNVHPSALAPKPKHRPITYLAPISSPLPNVAFAHAKPPSKSEPNKEDPDRIPSVSPSASAPFCE
ncbi:Filamentous hemagglutinin [Gossypium australe]|uniref:Filamentous hemagglutinin n=1 Tax=Gossypium australe TaxID=47621 RepID=A0A5B6VT72_9ROSI|nr:Filamentous hemagglutinin [Gossypium australe]